jgi:hypothetical protein
MRAEPAEEFWTDLTHDKAFLARVFVEHCIATKDEARMEDTMPVVAEQAFRIQEEYNKLDEDEITERSFMIGQLLTLAVHMDYTDQYGRTAMFKHASESFRLFTREEGCDADEIRGDDFSAKLARDLDSQMYGYTSQDRQ